MAWGDIVGSWQFIHDSVRLLTVIIQLNIIFLIVSAASFVFYMVLEAFAWLFILGSGSVERMLINVKAKSLRAHTLSEKEINRATRDSGFPELGLYRDLRCYAIRCYRSWQYMTSFLIIGAVWLAIGLIFLHTATSGQYMDGPYTPMDLANEVMENLATIIVFVVSMSAIVMIATTLMAIYRIWEYGVMESRIFGGKSPWQVIKAGFR